MVTPSPALPQSYAQPSMIAPATPQPTIPKTSGALVFQIFNPVNYAEGAPADAFQRSTAPASGTAPTATAASSSPNPFANPQQQLMDAYNQALNARNTAEQARNSYLNLANQLNGQAYQNQSQQANAFQAPPGLPGPAGALDPQALLQQQQAAAQMAQQQYLQQLQAMQQQQQQQYMQQYQQQLAQQQAMQQQQAMPQQQFPQQQPVDLSQQPQNQPVQPQGLENATTEELNRMIAQPQTLQEKVDAMEEIGVRGQGTAETYELLKQEALADTSMIPPGQAQDDANYVRQAALWTLGMLNKAANNNVPIEKLPGLGVIEQILSNKNESTDVKAAAIQALQVIGRLDDRRIKKILKKAAKDKNTDVQRLAQEALQGKTIPLPTQGGMMGMDPMGGMAGGYPGGMPAGFDPNQMQMPAIR